MKDSIVPGKKKTVIENMNEKEPDFFQEITSLSLNPHFQSLQETYLKDWSDIETFFLHLYTARYIRNQFIARYQKEITPEQLKTAIRFVFETRSLRLQAIRLFRYFQQHGERKTTEMIRRQSPIPQIPSFVFLKA